MKFSLGAMTVGDILDRSLKLLFSRFGTFYLINFLALLPLLAFQLYQPELGKALGGNIASALILLLVTILISMLLQAIGTAATLRVVEQEFVGRSVTIGDALGFAFGRFGAILGTGFLVGLVVGVGILLCVIPGLIFLIWFAFASQAVVVEGLAGSRAMSRSKALTEGYRGRVFGTLFLIGILVSLGTLAAYFLNRSMPGIEYVPRSGQKPDPFDPGIPVVNWQNYVINTVVSYLIQIVGGAFAAIATTLLYFDLRIRKEGFDLEVAANQRADNPDLDFRT